MRFRKLDMSLKDQRQALVDTFINSIYLYDDKVLITFNYKEGTQTITFEEAVQAASKGNGSDLDCIPAPENAVKSKDFMAFLFCEPWLHGFCTVFARWVLSMSDYVGHCIALQSVPFLHQVSSAKRSFAFISGSASLSNSSRAVMEMVGSPAAGTACGLGASGLA